jgi:hypothetical protein
MTNKTNFICKIPFKYTEIFDDRQYLCCPSWLNVNVWDGKSINSSFNSDLSKKIRESIIDGTYSFCDEIQCPYLSELKNGKKNSNFVYKTQQNIDDLLKKQIPETINFCFDRSCNLKCPSCRLDFINYNGKDRDGVLEKLNEIENELSGEIKRLYISGTSDPFFSKSFREFLINISLEKYKKLKSIHLHTNALLWTESLWVKMKNIHSLVKSCEISIDASSKETYENETRIGGNWNRLMENLKYITNISTIKHYTFSFVVQDTNYHEMYSFYLMITDLMMNRKYVNYVIFYNKIINWGTYSEDEYIKKDVTNPTHPDHLNFLSVLMKLKNSPNVDTNLNHLIPKNKTLI